MPIYMAVLKPLLGVGAITPPNRSRIASIGSITKLGALLATDCTAVLSSLSKCLIRQTPSKSIGCLQTFEVVRLSLCSLAQNQDPWLSWKMRTAKVMLSRTMPVQL